MFVVVHWCVIVNCCRLLGLVGVDGHSFSWQEILGPIVEHCLRELIHDGLSL